VYQQTIAEKVSCTGIGLHSGAPTQLVLHPARADEGVTFVRTDCKTPIEIPARSREISSTYLATTLGRGEASIRTVEHLLAALFGMGIDNVRVEVDGPELPVMDGSSAPFVYLIRSAGVFRQRERRRTLRIRRPIEIRDGDRRISVEPARDFRVHYAVDFEHPAIGRQELSLAPLDADRFDRELSAARTFGFLRDVRALWNAGLARGGSLDNAVLLDDTRVVNPQGLRWSDEFVRHKILDLCGDLALLGVPLVGHVKVERGGHSLHQRLVAAILERPECWVIDDPDRPHARGISLPRVAAAARV
jgi:UDP-3-O-[3-hydroxymyristoyl] N-acetylglucosamine deacetylase